MGDVTQMVMKKAADIADARLAALADAGLEIAKEEAPFKTGYLRDHIIVRHNGPMSYSIVSTAEYSAAVHEGHMTRGQKKGDAAKKVRMGEEVSFVDAKPFMEWTASRLRGGK